MYDIGLGIGFGEGKISTFNITASYSYRELRKITIGGYISHLFSLGVGILF